MAKRRRVQQQIKDVNKRYKRAIGKVQATDEKVLTEAAILIQNEALYLTPQDTNALINSQYRRLIRDDSARAIIRVGYTQNYAAALHETSWTPRRPDERSPAGGGYNPNAVPGFLEKGAQAATPDIKRLLVARYRNVFNGGRR